MAPLLAAFPKQDELALGRTWGRWHHSNMVKHGDLTMNDREKWWFKQFKMVANSDFNH